MRKYLRSEMKEELGEATYEALKAMEYVHAAVWMHFDPEAKLGDRKQPAEVKKALREIPKAFERFGLCLEGFEKEGEEVE